MFCFSIYCLCFTGKLQCVDGVAIDDVCYKLPYRAGPGVNFTQSNAICRFHGGELAEIPTRQVYNTVYKYIQSSWYYRISEELNNFVVINVWLGSSYNVSNHKVFRFLK